jgi:hypothetical protein
MTQTELVVHGIGLVILFALVVVKVSFWLCASEKPDELPSTQDHEDQCKG